MQDGWRLVTDLGLGVLAARGADALTFLQGQLSNDTTLLTPDALQLSGYHTPQGRVIALLRLTAPAPDQVLAVLPRELVAPVVTRLKRYVLRAKVQITDETERWQLLGCRGEASGLPGSALRYPYGHDRQLVLVPRTEALGSAGTGTREDWAAADITEGLAQVYLATSEAFVAQMLNLDLTGGIALAKGCYTGQEIIARAHYRGQVKRRMQRFATASPVPMKCGDGGTLADGRAFKVVEVAPHVDGRCEFLAVAPLLEGLAGGTEATPESASAGALAGLHAQTLALPYALPSR
jgi:tRNA-modifying protein YgfZ